ncbi:hypothetical protein ABVT39_007648 [Epinephelus coioides]
MAGGGEAELFPPAKMTKSVVWEHSGYQMNPQSQGKDPLLPYWAPVPSRSCSQAAVQRKLCGACRCRHPRLPGSCAGVSDAEILELAGNTARDNKKTRIIPRHLHYY